MTPSAHFMNKALEQAAQALFLSSPNPRVGCVIVDASDRIIYDIDSGRLYYDADGSGSGAAVQFARVAANLSLSADDFVII